MQRTIELDEYFDAHISANDKGKVKIQVYAKDGNDEDGVMYEEYAHGSVDEIEENAQSLIDEARNWFDDFSSAINVVDLHMKTVCKDGAEVTYGLVPPGGHIMEVKGIIEHNRIEDTLYARFEWYRGRGSYTPKIDKFYTDEVDISRTNSFSEANAKALIESTIELWEEQVERILNNNTDKDKVQEQLSNLG